MNLDSFQWLQTLHLPGKQISLEWTFEILFLQTTSWQYTCSWTEVVSWGRIFAVEFIWVLPCVPDRVWKAGPLQDWDKNNSGAKMSLVLIHQKLGFSAIHWGHPCWQHYDVMRNSIWCESPAKVPKIIGHMNVVTIGYSTFMKHRKKIFTCRSGENI